MRTFKCNCGNTVFFENSLCVSCGKELGWCPACNELRSIAADANGQYRCQYAGCGTLLTKCHNYAVEHVCNRCTVTQETPESVSNPLCDYCRFNDTIPDLTVEGNREKWRRLEIAKRRLLYTLDLLQLPYGNGADGAQPPLSFDFKEDVTQKHKWWAISEEESVFTGHAGGKITINVREADHVEREKARVSFKEAHRTLVGHFRHEIGHYYWEMLVPAQCEDACKAVFGDHENPTYSEALQQYYKEGPPANWQGNYISTYATMHAWEDFAETFATYLNMVSVLDTAHNMGITSAVNLRSASVNEMVDQYARLGVLLNEMNRAMGLIDLVPEVFAEPIVGKLEFVHNLLRDTTSRSP